MKVNAKVYKIFFILIVIFLFSIVNVSSLSVVVHVPEKYTDVEAGERFYFNVEVKYPENPKRKDLRLKYEVRTIEGELITQSKALKAVETQASFIEFVVLPQSAESGLYTINVEIEDYESLSEEVSSSFNVVGSQSDQFRIYFLIILVAIILIGVLVIISIRSLKKK